MNIPTPTPSPSQGIGEPEFPECATELIMTEDGSCVPASFYEDYVPENITETSTPTPLPYDDDLAVTGGVSDGWIITLATLFILGGIVWLIVSRKFRKEGDK